MRSIFWLIKRRRERRKKQKYYTLYSGYNYELFTPSPIYIPPPLQPIKENYTTYIDDKGYMRYKGNDRLVHREIAFNEIYLRVCSFCRSELNNGYRTHARYCKFCGRLIYRGRFSECHIHHKDHNKLNNNKDNLMVLTEREHLQIHRLKKW